MAYNRDSYSLYLIPPPPYLGVAYAGPRRSSSLGSAEANTTSFKYAFGFNPSSFALDSVVIKQAVAPSDKNEALAAVTVPFLEKAGLK